MRVCACVHDSKNHLLTRGTSTRFVLKKKQHIDQKYAYFPLLQLYDKLIHQKFTKMNDRGALQASPQQMQLLDLVKKVHFMLDIYSFSWLPKM
jgi:hypothetical protein